MKVREIKYAEEKSLNKPKKTKKKFKKRLRWLKFIVLSTLFITTVVLLALSPLFEIKSMEVVGSSKYKSGDIIAVTGLTTGLNGFKAIGGNVRDIFFLRSVKAEQNIQRKFPFIKKAKVQFVLPGKIKISLTERIPMGIVPFNGTNLVIDEEGFVVDEVNQGSHYKLPLIKGLKFQTFEMGQPLKLDNPDSLKNTQKLLKELKACDLDGKSRLIDLVSYVDAADTQKMCVNVESRITVNLGDLRELNYRLDFFKQIFLKNLKKDEKGTIDFTTGENPSFRPEK